MTNNQYHTQPVFSSATFPHQRSTSPQTPLPPTHPFGPKCFLPIKSHPVSFSHYVSLHSVKMLLSKGRLSKVTFSCNGTIAYSVSAPDMIVIRSTVLFTPLACRRKLLLSQLRSVFKSDSSPQHSFCRGGFDDVVRS